MAIKAVQQIMLGTVTGNDKQAREALLRIKQAGYEGIELNGFMIRPASFLVRALTKAAGMPVGRGGNLEWERLLQEAGLSVVSVHEDLGTLKRETQMVIEEAEKFHTPYIVITGMYRFDYSEQAAVEGLAEDLNKTGRLLKEAGLQLLYHNHNCEFRKVKGDKTAFEYIIENTDPSYVNFEFDSYWPTEAGADALAWMKHLGGRMKLYHISDRGARVQGTSMTPILKNDCIELGEGNMNLRLLLQQAIAVDVDAVILESHKNWIDNSPLKSIEKSAIFLRNNM